MVHRPGLSDLYYYVIRELFHIELIMFHKKIKKVILWDIVPNKHRF